jgi:hypothetical protein
MTDVPGSLEPPDAADDAPDSSPERSSGSLFRKTIIRVMSVQIVALLLLWLLQHTYGA